jgi:hypothetical protein
LIAVGFVCADAAPWADVGRTSVTSEAVQHLRDHWAEQGCLNRNPASDGEILAFENQYGVHLPQVVRDYFRLLNGTDGGQASMDDEEQISFWHLDQLRPLATILPNDDTPGAAEMFVFADWSLEVHLWALRLTKEEQPAPVFITYDTAQQVAFSFEEFVRRYLSKDKDVLWPERSGGRPTWR